MSEYEGLICMISMKVEVEVGLLLETELKDVASNTNLLINIRTPICAPISHNLISPIIYIEYQFSFFPILHI